MQNFPSSDLIVTLLDRVLVFGGAICERECTLCAKPFIGISINFPLSARKAILMLRVEDYCSLLLGVVEPESAE
jgi:hypothetical protein